MGYLADPDDPMRSEVDCGKEFQGNLREPKDRGDSHARIKRKPKGTFGYGSDAGF
jgi:hypothetical protein